MITNSFDNKSKAKINPTPKDNRLKCSACIITFSNIIEEYVLNNFDVEQYSNIRNVTRTIPIYKLKYNDKIFAFYKTDMGASAAIGCLEDVTEVIDTKKFIVFGGSGCLDKEIARGKVMIPTFAYRDEGTSYHYKEATDYIEIKNSSVVKEFMEQEKIPYVAGRTWTTDSFYRETENNIQKRKEEGCISVEMECSAYQAVCDFRGYDLYFFLTSGDLLDAPIWSERKIDDKYTGTQHDSRHFDIAIRLADFITNNT